MTTTALSQRYVVTTASGSSKRMDGESGSDSSSSARSPRDATPPA